mmetsp:Transcript_10322/g.21817  ORF Transcript_10322/g.21817 Transcript_10322/m.21817 type:complete len:101 (+) Transcript_10322:2003-2305(+)
MPIRIRSGTIRIDLATVVAAAVATVAAQHANSNGSHVPRAPPHSLPLYVQYGSSSTSDNGADSMGRDVYSQLALLHGMGDGFLTKVSEGDGFGREDAVRV